MTLRILHSQILIISVFLLSAYNESTPTDELSVSFEMDKISARVGETITFTNTSQHATSYEWDFGDGNSSTEENPSHAYSSTGEFTITLTSNGDKGSESTTKSNTIWDIELESTFYGDSIKFKGPTNFKSQPVKFLFNNQSSGIGVANLVKHNEGYSHQEMLRSFVNGISSGHHPSWTTEVDGVWKQTNTNKTHTWIGTLEPGIYTLVSASYDPLVVWYVAGLTVSND